MAPRPLRVLLVLLLAIAAGAALLLRPGPGMPDIKRVEMALGRDQLVIERRRDTGQWVIASANDAPGDPERIGQLVDALLSFDGGSPVAALPPDEPMELRLTAADGRVLRHLALWPGVARALPDGAPFATSLDRPELAPSAWSTLAPPAIDPAMLVTAVAIGPGGATALPPADRAALAADLGGIGAAGWVPARQLDWTTASYVQATRSDGVVVEIQRLTLGDGRRFIRLTSDRDPALRAVRFFAFPLPDASGASKGGRG
jgi:hypothetical protein